MGLTDPVLDDNHGKTFEKGDNDISMSHKEINELHETQIENEPKNTEALYEYQKEQRAEEYK